MSDQDLALQAMNNGTFTSTKYYEQSLTIYHQARAQVPGGSRPALVWDADLTQGAQDYANTMAQTGIFKHSGAPPGENISFFSSDMPGGNLLVATNGWLDEKASYHGEQVGQTGPGGSYEDWGHYTQVSFLVPYWVSRPRN